MAMAQISTRGSGFVDAMTFDPEYAARHKHQRQQPIRGALSRGHGRGAGPVDLLWVYYGYIYIYWVSIASLSIYICVCIYIITGQKK